MAIVTNFKRGKLLVVVFLFVFSGCYRSQSWKSETLTSVLPPYASQRYLLLPQGVIEDVEMELIQTDGCSSLFINILQCPIASADKAIEISLISNEDTYQTYGILLEGGQRIRLSEEDTAQIIDLLRLGAVRICFCDYNILMPPL